MMFHLKLSLILFPTTWSLKYFYHFFSWTTWTVPIEQHPVPLFVHFVFKLPYNSHCQIYERAPNHSKRFTLKMATASLPKHCKTTNIQSDLFANAEVCTHVLSVSHLRQSIISSSEVYVFRWYINGERENRFWKHFFGFTSHRYFIKQWRSRTTSLFCVIFCISVEGMKIQALCLRYNRDKSITEGYWMCGCLWTLNMGKKTSRSLHTML